VILESSMSASERRIKETDPRGGSQYSLLGASRRHHDPQRYKAILLVEYYERGGCRIHRQVSDLPES